MAHSRVRRDETLQDPLTVFQVLKRHYARYTPELVQEACGVTPEDFLRVCESVVRNSGREKTTAWVYSVGWTHHTVGVQYIRSAAIIQLLLGNMGRPGGGILALRGHASIQGSTDIPTLFNLLPGYLPMPKVGEHDDLQSYLKTISSPEQKGYWAEADAYTVSLLKSYWGDAATAENDYCFKYLPRLTGDHGTYATVMGMLEDKVEGYLLLGQNPAVGSAHGRMQRLAMAHLKYLVVRDLNMIESATFWKDSPEIATGELVTKDIGTEVFFFPAAAHAEKDGSFTQTQRVLQWHHKAVEPPGDCRSDLHFFFHLGRMMREKLAGSTLLRDRPLLDLVWNYPVDETGEPSADAVLQEINGAHLTGEHAGEMLRQLHRDEGRRIHVGWLLDLHRCLRRQRQSGGQTDTGRSSSRGLHRTGVGHGRRIAGCLYNRASADPDGKPWSEAKALVWWDAEKKTWTGHDIPDFPVDTAPDYRPEAGTGGPKGLAGDDPFVMQGDGKGWLYAPTGLLDGPLPSHYEPHESPVSNPLYRQQANPTRQVFRRSDNLSNPSGNADGAQYFPYVFTTYRLTEHHTAGGMSRWLPYLSELQPEFFCEVSPGAGAGTKSGTHGMGHHRHRPYCHRGQSAGDGTDGSIAGRRPHHPSDRPALPLGRRQRCPGER